MVDIKLGMLFDYYGELLTDKQQTFFRDYYFDNLTLQEIADNYSISRNAVHKTLNTINKKLEFYEAKLRLYEKAEKMRELVVDLDDDIKEKIYDLI